MRDFVIPGEYVRVFDFLDAEDAGVLFLGLLEGRESGWEETPKRILACEDSGLFTLYALISERMTQGEDDER